DILVSGKYVGNRPIKLRKSKWRERTDFDALEKQKNHIQKKPKMSRKGILHKGPIEEGKWGIGVVVRDAVGIVVAASCCGIRCFKCGFGVA
ncbi:RNA-binding protein 42-like, partial [Trifolium pratense]